MPKIYKTKKRKAEFKKTYIKIGELNQYIINYEIEIETHINNNNFDEAIGKQKIVNDMKLELLEIGKKGWDINYTTPQVSGYYVIPSSPELNIK